MSTPRNPENKNWKRSVAPLALIAIGLTGCGAAEDPQATQIAGLQDRISTLEAPAPTATSTPAIITSPDRQPTATATEIAPNTEKLPEYFRLDGWELGILPVKNLVEFTRALKTVEDHRVRENASLEEWFRLDPISRAYHPFSTDKLIVTHSEIAQLPQEDRQRIIEASLHHGLKEVYSQGGEQILNEADNVYQNNIEVIPDGPHKGELRLKDTLINLLPQLNNVVASTEYADKTYYTVQTYAENAEALRLMNLQAYTGLVAKVCKEVLSDRCTPAFIAATAAQVTRLQVDTTTSSPDGNTDPLWQQNGALTQAVIEVTSYEEALQIIMAPDQGPTYIDRSNQKFKFICVTWKDDETAPTIIEQDLRIGANYSTITTLSLHDVRHAFTPGKTLTPETLAAHIFSALNSNTLLASDENGTQMDPTNYRRQRPYFKTFPSGEVGVRNQFLLVQQGCEVRPVRTPQGPATMVITPNGSHTIVPSGTPNQERTPQPTATPVQPTRTPEPTATKLPPLEPTNTQAPAFEQPTMVPSATNDYQTPVPTPFEIKHQGETYLVTFDKTWNS